VTADRAVAGVPFARIVVAEELGIATSRPTTEGDAS
jgi:hypothetical protein